MKILFKIFFAGVMLQSFLSFSQEKERDTTKVKVLDEVLVSAVRANEKQPVTFTNMSKKELAERNLGQDIPVLMNYMPSVVTTTDAGNGVGYTGIRVRGSDATRVNVTINGIAYNDSESHGTYWVNMPDFVSSVENLQLQRGVGTSTNGAGAFGASLNMLTDSYATKGNGEISNSYGSFNTHKHTVKFSTGLMNDKFELAGRFSKINSDGYIDRASSDLKSYFLQGTYVGKTTLIKALVFGGKEKTYQAWNGIDPSAMKILNLNENMVNDNPTYNISGIQTDSNGNIEGYYDNEIDNYQQDHAQLHWNEKINDSWSTNLALHYTKGKGYFEQYVDDWYYSNVLGGSDSQLSFLGLDPIVVNGQTITSMDYIRDRWLDNDFYGTTFSVNHKSDKLDMILGGAWNNYEGKHFGNVIWSQYSVPYNYQYYNDSASKNDVNAFAKAGYKVSSHWSLFGDLQWRRVNYKANSDETGLVDDTFNFFNPKAGVTYTLNSRNNFYFSYARANREPNRTDYENGSPKPEQLDDFELGWRYATLRTKLNVNAYYMAYKDQLVLTGELDEVGSPIRANSGDSYRLGLEVDAAIAVLEQLVIRPNVTVSVNKNKDFMFQRDGVLQNLGDTNIAYSPNFIAGNIISYSPVKTVQLSLFTKIVGEQFMGNIDSETSKLDGYFVNDFSVNWEIKPKSVLKSIVVSGLVNNIFDYKYVSNGYFYTYDDDFSNPGTVTTIEGAGYYPQAGINAMVGLTLKF
ncbi:thiamin-regulated outer membrane receptor Omr1 [Flavobacterium enshiense DK69]|uniref:TonB-dependent receptor n=1 Tax=Flavobacterium enshiense DK69 TaxID=1107311 RepID=V6S8W4_9FLAO|nr:TonB-dependent receptor [Flavobacterium enshiense]ESU23123.1 thiamin-regulated outer membrane receptor Omr1 [Flavobacterium enshiense DK69]KGO96015.1 TonB-dependent receptor [Flavobacterium enshiense DK69]